MVRSTKMVTSRFEVKVIPEGLMPRSVYDQQAREHDLGLGKLWTMETNAQTVSTAYMHQAAGVPSMVRTTLTHLLHHLGLLSDGLIRDEGCSNLLCDTPGLSILHVCSANLVQNFSLAGVHMPQDAHHRGTEEVRRALFFMSLTPVLRVEATSITACHSIHHTLTLVHHRWKT